MALQEIKLFSKKKIEGPEVSIFALCDGEKLIVLPPAQDHKRLLDGDNGPNTGGMGAYAPALLINEQDLKDLTELVLIPTLKGLKKKEYQLHRCHLCRFNAYIVRAKSY